MRTKRSFTQPFKEEAVRLVLQEKLSVPAAARRIEISEKTLANWVRLARRGKPLNSGVGSAEGKASPVSDLEMEVSKLRAEVARLKMEKEILKNGLRGHPRPMDRNTRRYTVIASVSGRLLFGGSVPVKKPGPREAADPIVVARFATPFRKVI